MHTRKGGTLRFTQQQLNQRVGYTEFIMRYHPKGTAYIKYRDMHFTAKPQRIRASKVFYLNQGKKMVQRSALYIV